MLQGAQSVLSQVSTPTSSPRSEKANGQKTSRKRSMLPFMKNNADSSGVDSNLAKEKFDQLMSFDYSGFEEVSQISCVVGQFVSAIQERVDKMIFDGLQCPSFH